MEARTMSSPLEPIFGRAQAPAAFKAQFLHSVDDPCRIVLEGTLHHVWHRPGWLRPLFQLLGRLHILVPDTGTEIPTTLEVIGQAAARRTGDPCLVAHDAFSDGATLPNHDRPRCTA